MGGRKHDLDDLIKTNVEQFRAEATEALQQFSNDDRTTAKRLASRYATATTVLKAWDEQIEPMYRSLEAKQSDTRLRKSLERHFGFHEGDTSQAIDFMVTRRKQSLLDEVLDNVYHSDIEEPPEARVFAAQFLSQSPTEISDFYRRLQQYELYSRLAAEHEVVVIDPHTSWIERQRTAALINRERQQSEEANHQRLIAIESEISALLNDHPLLDDILDHHVSTVQLLDIATKYHRHLAELSDKEKTDPTVALQIFERVTHDFIETETKQIAHSHHVHTLKTLNKIRNDISELVLEVCELSSSGRNRLLLAVQTYTKLLQERSMIELIQRNRSRALEEA